MKVKKRDLIILGAVIIIVALLTLIYGFNRSNTESIGNSRFKTLSTTDYIALMDSSSKHAWFYVYSNSKDQYGGLNEDDGIERIYIAQNGKAKLYKDRNGKVPTFRTFEGLSPLAIVQRIEGNMIPDFDFEASDVEYTFLATPEDNGDVLITVQNTERSNDSYQFQEIIPPEDIVNDVAVGTLRVSGYLYQSDSANFFNKFQTLALVTPIELVID